MPPKEKKQKTSHAQYFKMSSKELLKLQVKKLSPHATLPVRGSAQAAGYDLASAVDITIPARGKGLVKTDIAIALPEGLIKTDVVYRSARRTGLEKPHRRWSRSH
eukprot:g5755.t1